eukprot:944908-Heterocapsa_arctica.AAC.1
MLSSVWRNYREGKSARGTPHRSSGPSLLRTEGTRREGTGRARAGRDHARHRKCRFEDPSSLPGT